MSIHHNNIPSTLFVFMDGPSRMKTLQQPRAIKTRDRILRSAARLFAIKGFRGTTVGDVVKSAEVTSGAFFHHFGSKDDLGFAVIERHMELRRRELDRIEAEMPAETQPHPLDPVFRRLDAVREMVARRKLKQGGCVIGNLSTALADTHPEFRRQLSACFDEMAAEFQPGLDAAAHACGAEQRMETAEVARYIVTIIEGAIMLSRTGRDLQLLDRHFEYLKDHLRQMFAASH